MLLVVLVVVVLDAAVAVIHVVVVVVVVLSPTFIPATCRMELRDYQGSVKKMLASAKEGLACEWFSASSLEPRHRLPPKDVRVGRRGVKQRAQY